VAVKPHFSLTGQYIDRHTVTMDAQIFPASPDATREFLDARRAVFRAIALDHKSGVSANRIADMVSGAISRPVVLAYLTAEQLRRDAHDAVRVAQLDEMVDVGATGEVGRGARIVYVTPAADPRELTTEDSASLLSRVVDALRPAGIALARTGDDGTGDDGTTAAFRHGEEIPLGRHQPRVENLGRTREPAAEAVTT
jgi:hypothetical protein